MHNVKDILNQFKLDKPKKKVFGNYRIEKNSLIWKTIRTYEIRVKNLAELKKHLINKKLVNCTLEQAKMAIKNSLENNYAATRLKFTGIEINEIARKIISDNKTIFLGNSSILPLIGRNVSYGNERLNSEETEIQKEMSKQNFVMIPFNVFSEAKLDLNKYKLIDRGNEEKVIVNVKKHDRYWKEYTDQEERHFTGASLFEVEGKAYLFDIDRKEIENNIFNPFLASINGKPKTIKEAYDLLKPLEVKKAERQGKKVLRQGEWFFIQCKTPKIKKLTDKQKVMILASRVFNDALVKSMGIKENKSKVDKLIDSIPKQGNIRAGESRPNTVERLIKQGKNTFASGVVKHTGREHKDLDLGKNWFKVVPNTSIKNFTITGDID